MDAKVPSEVKAWSLDGVGAAAAPNSCRVLASRQAVSYWTCSKLCAICFVGGVLFGYSLRGRVKRWASKLLKKLT